MNVAVINIKETWKYLIKVILIIAILSGLIKYLSNSGQSMKKTLISDINSEFLIQCIKNNLPIFENTENFKTKTVDATSLLSLELGFLPLNSTEEKQDIAIEEKPQENIEEISQETTLSPTIEISKIAQTETVSDRNFLASYTDIYNTTKIDNQSKFTLTEEMMKPDIEIKNKKDILIYHTHTCESYTPCDTYNYQMTGNYRTTDSNYNIVRVGKELTTYLSNKGFNVTHNDTYHDYPSYSGAYSRSLQTANDLMYGKDASIVIDLHRDAMGNGDTYGPSIMVNNQRVAQLMFVIGTNGGGLEHENWTQNLKIAIKIQETANQMYPGLFRPIIIRNSRYNQHVAEGASIIEVGATANTLEECLLSMQCLANVVEEVCK